MALGTNDLIALGSGAALLAGLVTVVRALGRSAPKHTESVAERTPPTEAAAPAVSSPEPASSPIPDEDLLARRETVEPTASQPPAVEEDDAPTQPFPKITVTAVAGTHPGLKRDENEDSHLVFAEQHVYLVADGMGGHASGEVASKLAVETIQRAFASGEFAGTPNPKRPRLADELVRAVEMANQAVFERSKREKSDAGMGTTIVAARFAPNKQRVYIVHVGDSRCYRKRGKSIVPITADHTLASLGATGPNAGRLIRSVGTEAKVLPDLLVEAPEPGDVYILCSDGLYRMVPEDLMDEILGASPDLEVAVAKMIEMANERGGVDNISVILVRVGEAAEMAEAKSA